ncbi:hypothetical protein [Saccharopolyspora hattusasensis]|uniref:hypothetical protein n=1 Tax=Saccharopolyspora hattusasensis TaxID=1128679 RepID=UPI003D975226
MTAALGVLTPFPEEEAQRVLEYAKKLGQSAVAGMVNTIRDLLGHPENISPRVDAWGFDAKKAIDESVGSITNARADLKAYWSGSAFDSFSVYIDHLEKVFNGAGTVFGKMSDHLQDIASTMTDLYNQAIAALINCAATIVQATGGVIAHVKEFFIGVAEPIANAIAEFIRIAGQVVTQAQTAISEYRRTGQDLKQEVTDLKVPETIPSSSVDTGGWNVRKRV